LKRSQVSWQRGVSRLWRQNLISLYLYLPVKSIKFEIPRIDVFLKVIVSTAQKNEMKMEKSDVMAYSLVGNEHLKINH
jgi:hypothetical protein